MEGKRELTMSMNKAQILGSIIGILPSLFLGIIYYKKWSRNIIKGMNIFDSFAVNITIYIFIVLILIVFHELLHCFGFLLSKDVSLKDVKIGVKWKSLTPYAHCSKAIDVRIYRIAIFLPTLVLGIIPTFIALMNGNVVIILYGLIMLSSGGGDIIILWMLRNLKSNIFVKDSIEKIGCEIYENPCE